MADLVQRVVRDVRPSSLTSPVGALMRPTLRIESLDSLALAAARLRENGATVLPVVEGDRLVGVVTDASLGRALGHGIEPTDAVGEWLDPAETVRPYDTGAGALRRCAEGTTLVVVDEAFRVMGLVASSDLWPRRRVPMRPPMVGGMATPFGVYLTTGAVRGGVHPLALMATGAAMFGMLLVGAILGELASDRLAGHAPAAVVNAAGVVLMIGTFLGLMRLAPLSGTHGAEHQVVHAIERDEELVPSIVRRMPRVHPRCGTNLAVGATIFMNLFFWEWTSDRELRLLAAVIPTLLLWRTLGGILQQYVTTKRPSDRQLAGGIRAGNELLERYASAPVAVPSIGQRLWNSGLFQVMAGAFLTAAVVTGISSLFHFDLGISLY